MAMTMTPYDVVEHDAGPRRLLVSYFPSGASVQARRAEFDAAIAADAAKRSAAGFLLLSLSVTLNPDGHGARLSATALYSRP
jgi:hypothetical protein